jgi:ribA/ribD-fused uncharacterized protein
MAGRATTPRPILVEFLWGFNREQILDRARMLYQSGITVEEDFPVEIAQRRATLIPIVRKAQRTKGFYDAKLVGDKMLVRGRSYTVDTVENLPEAINPCMDATKTDGQCTLFYSRFSKLSNHNPAPFMSGDLIYRSSEQMYFAERCRVLGDEDQRRRVLAASDPKDCQRLGRQAKNLSGIKWSEFEEPIMKKACLEKFTKNSVARQALLMTAGTVLGESSRSKHWGTGFYVSHPQAFNQDLWENNLLGRILSEVRDEVRALTVQPPP